MSIDGFSGGLSNFLYYVALPETRVPFRDAPQDQLKTLSEHSFCLDEPKKVQTHSLSNLPQRLLNCLTPTTHERIAYCANVRADIIVSHELTHQAR